eukprot:TRINITY_DN1272_c1_g1_i14.p1 TRINITY_DN1272_c1_g1~~TRINITY_DN1272_c1_g1_i14.p1  ORF type:complete len:761 (+),score=148.48 TRINITY_DN1272_c1_g1_i14:29-2284(+)
MASLPIVILANVFQSLEDKDLKAARKVSKKWAKTVEDEGYWAMRVERELGGATPVQGVTNKAFHQGFKKLGTGSVEWLVWYDDVSKTWMANEELLGLFAKTTADSSLCVVSVCPASTRVECQNNAAKFLSTLMRTKNAFANPDSTTMYSKGLQVWSNPSVFADGTQSLFLLAQGIGSSKNTEEVDEITQQLQLLTYCLSSMVFILDDENMSGVKWWDALLPSISTPRSVTQPAVPTKGSKLTVVSASDLSIPNHTAVSPEDRERVGAWLSHFDELCMLNTEWSDPDWYIRLASDCLQTTTPHWGCCAPIHHPGHLWPSLATTKLSLQQFTDITTCVVERINDQPHALFNHQFNDIISTTLFERLVKCVTGFYTEAMHIELESGPLQAAELAHHGQAAEAPAEVPAPLWSTQLIEAHEQHLFASCRKLILRMGEAGMTGQATFKFFEMLKNKISDEFRKVWGINQGRSKAFCETTFDLVFEGIEAKYTLVPLEVPTESPTTSSSSYASGTSGFESKKVREFEKNKEDVKQLKRFYQSFIDHLDEYMMKAIGTRRGDVMLCKTRDLLERVEARKAGNFNARDLELASTEICSEVTARVVKETGDMEKTRNTMQKTCALYTKLLGMQCRQRVSAMCKEKWTEEQTNAVNRYAARVQLYCAVMGEEAAQECNRDEVERTVEGIIAEFGAAEKTASDEVNQFISQLPASEKGFAYKFGIVTNQPSSAASLVSNIQNKAKAKGANLLFKVKKRLGKA